MSPRFVQGKGKMEILIGKVIWALLVFLGSVEAGRRYITEQWRRKGEEWHGSSNHQDSH